MKEQTLSVILKKRNSFIQKWVLSQKLYKTLQQQTTPCYNMCFSVPETRIKPAYIPPKYHPSNKVTTPWLV